MRGDVQLRGDVTPLNPGVTSREGASPPHHFRWLFRPFCPAGRGPHAPGRLRGVPLPRGGGLKLVSPRPDPSAARGGGAGGRPAGAGGGMLPPASRVGDKAVPPAGGGRGAASR